MPILLIVDLLAEREAFGKKGVEEIVKHFPKHEILLWAPHIENPIDYSFGKNEDFEEIENTFSLETAHESAPQQYDFAEIIDLTGNTASVRWTDSGKTESVDLEGMIPAEQDIVSGRIDLGRCMFCGLCMESCPFNSFFMTNEYDGMSGLTRDDLWMDAARTRVLPVVHKEAVDRELAKRADKERAKRERAAKKASKEA